VSAAAETLLALDTSGPTARVAVVGADGRARAAAEKTVARHSSNLLRLCDDVMRSAGVTVAELAAIACGAGPGSFTGLRVGMAVAKGLAMPGDLPLVLVSSLEALGRDLLPPAGGEALIVPCIDAGKEQVYARLFVARGGRLEARDEEWALGAAELCARIRDAGGAATPVLGGTGVERYRATFAQAFGEAAVPPAVIGPTALSVAALALERLARGERDDLARAVPSYGRPPDITKPRRPPPTGGSR
jgi:tRNA threonylcarbamoyladenosine biosynthesis protein TsaB